MIIKRIWLRSVGSREWTLEGWFLLGFIPLYIRDCAPRGRFVR